tara:strand:+ start:1344 stop:1739 length:396 start_codon:yes stop_codon:yes gene_type:complete
MAAKMKSRKYNRYIRADWKDVQVQVMEWCLRVKLAQNWNMFRNDLIDTGEQPIVEFSNRDDYWGAIPTDESTLQGQNVLGKLLMELRGRLKNSDSSLKTVEPLSIPDFNLYACSITLVKPFPKQEQGRLEL